MPIKKENRKIRYTRKVIHQAFLELIAKKDLSHITVTEICELADINRTTFYAHYDNCLDLLQKSELEAAKDIVAAMPLIKRDAENNDAVTIIHTLYEDPSRARWLFSDWSTGCGIQYIYEKVWNNIEDFWPAFRELSDEEMHRFNAFAFYGVIAFIKEWYHSGFSGKEEDVADQLKEIIQCTMQYIYH